MPCTTSRAISSSKVTPWSTALTAATAGQMTTSPSSRWRPVGASMEAGPVPPSSGERPLRSISSSMGNDRTSVGPCLSRNRSFSAAMDGSSTKSSDTSVSS